MVDIAQADDIFFQEGYQHTREAMRSALTLETFTTLCTTFYDAMDGLIDSFITRCRKEGKKVACMAGCSYCCNQCVLVLPHEMLFLSRHISNTFTRDRKKDIIQKICTKEKATRSMRAQEFLHYKHPCPLLSERGACSVYPARPMACRTYLSANVISCIDELKNPFEVETFPDLYDFPIRAGRMINMGITRALEEKNIFNTEWLFEASLKTSLEAPGSFKRWLSGEDLFCVRALESDEISYMENFGKRKTL
jgi:Fe-S-cluster containining protein